MKQKAELVDKIVEGLASSIVFTILLGVVVSILFFDFRGEGSIGLFCNFIYCFKTFSDFLGSDAFYIGLFLSSAVFFIIGYKFGFNCLYDLFISDKKNR